MQITRKEGVGDLIFARKSLVLYNVAAVCIVFCHSLGAQTLA